MNYIGSVDEGDIPWS